jgi:hypothetical protein
MLETYTLKQKFHQARVELSHALYENDASKRVIARLLRERDEARTQLANMQPSAIPAAAPAAAPPKSPKRSPKKAKEEQREEPVAMEIDSVDALPFVQELDAKAGEYVHFYLEELFLWLIDYRKLAERERLPKPLHQQTMSHLTRKLRQSTHPKMRLYPWLSVTLNRSLWSLVELKRDTLQFRTPKRRLPKDLISELIRDPSTHWSGERVTWVF